ncbi:hypothetical protein [Haliovirga abyssi]|uniref:Uncharacterized protein n=1 Tax=Haliovirga abyssi TaxID=2996794 RepID=A0AAU9DVS0_9FUSO|nr:hypothetical protein [Haliovirga abyssi]BDU51474.1 hypothetical protein HLVA_20430 [Haliovirga abyssi]
MKNSIIKKVLTTWKGIILSLIMFSLYSAYFFTQPGSLMGRMIDDQIGAPKDKIIELLGSYSPSEIKLYISKLIPLDFGFVLFYSIFFICVLVYFGYNILKWRGRKLWLLGLGLPMLIAMLDMGEDVFIRSLLLNGIDSSDLIFKVQFWITLIKGIFQMPVLIFACLFTIFLPIKTLFLKLRKKTNK